MSLDKTILESVGEMAPVDIQLRGCLRAVCSVLWAPSCRECWNWQLYLKPQSLIITDYLLTVAVWGAERTKLLCGFNPSWALGLLRTSKMWLQPSISFQAVTCHCQQRVPTATKWGQGPLWVSAHWGKRRGKARGSPETGRKDRTWGGAGVLCWNRQLLSHLLLKVAMLFFSTKHYHDPFTVFDSYFWLGFLDKHIRQPHNAVSFWQDVSRHLAGRFRVLFPLPFPLVESKQHCSQVSTKMHRAGC